MRIIDPAFPSETASDYFHGLTRRQYIAIEAMKSLIRVRGAFDSASDMKMVTNTAYKYADAMIKEGEV